MPALRPEIGVRIQNPSAAADRIHEKKNGPPQRTGFRKAKVMDIITKSYETKNGLVEGVQVKWQGFSILLVTGSKGFRCEKSRR